METAAYLRSGEREMGARKKDSRRPPPLTFPSDSPPVTKQRLSNNASAVMLKEGSPEGSSPSRAKPQRNVKFRAVLDTGRKMFVTCAVLVRRLWPQPKHQRFHRRGPAPRRVPALCGLLLKEGLRLLWWLWAGVCALGGLLSRFPALMFSSQRRRHCCEVGGGAIEDGGDYVVDSLPGSRSGSANSKIDGWHTPRSCGAGTDAVGRGSSYYYDVEEGQFQPSQRLLFRRTGSDLGYAAVVDMVPSPLTIGSKLYQITAGVQQKATTHMRSSSRSYSAASAGVAPASTVDARGYFVSSYGATVGRGAFQIIACMGHGTYSSVWLAIDVRGVTARVMPTMIHRMEDNSGYNSSASILGGGLQHAFVVLKVSRCLPDYVKACEEEFATNKMLLMELQRRGFSTERFLLYPSSFVEPSAVLSSAQSPRPQTSAPLQPDRPTKGTGVHMVQVGDVCGPSLLMMVTDAPPVRCGSSMTDRKWRLMCVQCIVRQLLEALESLHQCGVVHSDLKPENMLFGLPAVEFLEKMQSEARSRYMSAPQQSSMYHNLVIARHRAELICHSSTWDNLIQRNKQLAESGLDASDAARAACCVKLADLGSSLRIPTVPGLNSRSPQKGLSSHGSGSWSKGSTGPLCLPSVGSAPPSLPSSVASSTAAADELQPPTPQSNRRSCPILPGDVHWSATILQTREYRSPECIVQLHPSTMITHAMDIWSMGCVAYELVTGHYLLHPRLVALQRREQQHQAPTAEDDEAETDRIHIAMMEDLVCSPAPAELRQEGLFSARHFGASDTSGPGAEVSSANNTHSVQDTTHAKRVRFILALLHHHLNPECRAQQAAGCLQSGCPEWDDQLSSFAAFLAAALRWLPWERPSAAELLQSNWIRQQKF